MTSPDLALAVAEEVAEELGAGRFDRVVARFDDRMADALPADRLAAAWGTLEPGWGAFRARHSSTVTGGSNDRTSVVVRCAFERGYGDVQVTVEPDGRVSGLHLRPAPDPEGPDEAEAIARVGRSIRLAVPLMLLVPVAYAVSFRLWDVSLRWPSVALGAGGWALALAMRAPVGVVAKRFAPARATTIVIASSGPLEEGVRALILIAAGRTFRDALSIGLGWAAVEIVYTVANASVALSMARRDSAKGQAVRAMLARQGQESPRSPLAGILERASASAYHIGATMLLAWRLDIAVPMMAYHSAMNLASRPLGRRGVAPNQVMVLLAGSAVFVAGLGVWDRL